MSNDVKKPQTTVPITLPGGETLHMIVPAKTDEELRAEMAARLAHYDQPFELELTKQDAVAADVSDQEVERLNQKFYANGADAPRGSHQRRSGPGQHGLDDNGRTFADREAERPRDGGMSRGVGSTRVTRTGGIET